MECLYRSDYGPVDPHFNPLAGGGALLKGFAAHAPVLATAQNLSQREAMKRQLLRGHAVHWCEQGYAWTETPATTDLFYGFFAFLILPWLILRVLPALHRRLAPRRAAAASARAETLP